MKKPHTSNQKRSSTTIAIGFASLVAIVILGAKLYSQQALANEHFSPVVPGAVNIVGIDPGAGYQIIVANQMAQLVQASGEFGAKEDAGGGPTEGAIKKRIPVREMLQVLQGNGKALGNFVMNLNGMSENDNWPPIHIVWTKEDIEKAFRGDKVLHDKLVRDLNVQLDGSPLPSLRLASLQNGIILDYPVSVQVNQNGNVVTVVGRVEEPFKPKLIQSVEVQYRDKADVTQSMILGYYIQESKKILANPRDKQNIQKEISIRLSPENAQNLASAANRVLRSATPVINESFITGATHRTYDTTRGKMNDLTIELNDEGRRRLWKYSENRVHTHLLLVADGIPIAAPIIQHELSQGELTISQMEDEGLVRDAENILNQHATKAVNH